MCKSHMCIYIFFLSFCATFSFFLWLGGLVLAGFGCKCATGTGKCRKKQQLEILSAAKNSLINSRKSKTLAISGLSKKSICSFLQHFDFSTGTFAPISLLKPSTGIPKLQIFFWLAKTSKPQSLRSIGTTGKWTASDPYLKVFK